ncbi:MAG: DUF4184 family protein [Verrucomicrobiota bacterium]|jgi:hypothetical protein
MPFPVAHPAAILPLRRYCPRYLSFPALIVGSLSPDFSYLFGRLHVAGFSHRFWAGSFGFCLPAGLLIVWVFYLVRSPLLEFLPGRYRELFRHLNRQPGMFGFRPSDFGVRFWPWLALPLSVLSGAWTHDLLDSLSHPEGWPVQLMSALRQPVFRLAATGVPVGEFLYAGFTFWGAAWVAGCYLRWLGQAAGSPALRRPATRRTCALLFGAATLALALAGRGQRQLLGLIPLGILTVAVVLGFIAATVWLFTPKQG